MHAATRGFTSASMPPCMLLQPCGPFLPTSALTDEQVLRLDVSVHNVVLMAPAHCSNQLVDVLPDLHAG